jgi:hypothetical protein
VYVRVTATTVSLEEADDFGRFHVVTDAPEQLDNRLRAAGWGRRPGDDAFVAIDALRAAGAAASGDGWAEGFAKMLAFAESRGWVDDDGTAIQAHVEVEPGT